MQAKIHFFVRIMLNKIAKFTRIISNYYPDVVQLILCIFYKKSKKNIRFLLIQNYRICNLNLVMIIVLKFRIQLYGWISNIRKLHILVNLSLRIILSSIFQIKRFQIIAVAFNRIQMLIWKITRWILWMKIILRK